MGIWEPPNRSKGIIAAWFLERPVGLDARHLGAGQVDCFVDPLHVLITLGVERGEVIAAAVVIEGESVEPGAAETAILAVDAQWEIERRAQHQLCWNRYLKCHISGQHA